MNIKRFHAPTAREALAKARMAFGDGTLILSNRSTANGVEVVATAEENLSALDAPGGLAAISQGHGQGQGKGVTGHKAAPVAASAPAKTTAARNPVVEDTEQLAMSTLSFQDYVRERMLRRRHEALQESLPTRQNLRPATATREREPELQRPATSSVTRHNPMRPMAQEAVPQESARKRQESAVAEAAIANQHKLMNELQTMKDLIEDRFNTLSWLGQARQDPTQSNLMLKMIRAGYSPSLARAVLERMPDDLSAAEAVSWLTAVLERNLKTDAHARPLYEQGGIFALVGSTGVGKTTTAAKLAAMCARVHGPGSVGLITLDTYRIGAHEQLRNYGRMLGVVAHLAHDRAALQDLLGLLSGKKMVLIDTTGVAPRDPRKRDMLNVLDLPGVNRLLVLNASCHGDTLDDVLTGFRTEGAQQAILSKVDEAVKLGPAIDALIRHKMVLRGVTNGQRVPEDWEAADAHSLVTASMRTPVKSAFDPQASDLNFFFSHATDSMGQRSLIDA